MQDIFVKTHYFRSGSESYFLNGPDDRHSSSDHSDKYNIYQYNMDNDIHSKEQRFQNGKLN